MKKTVIILKYKNPYVMLTALTLYRKALTYFNLTNVYSNYKKNVSPPRPYKPSTYIHARVFIAVLSLNPDCTRICRLAATHLSRTEHSRKKNIRFFIIP